MIIQTWLVLSLPSHRELLSWRKRTTNPCTAGLHFKPRNHPPKTMILRLLMRSLRLKFSLMITSRWLRLLLLLLELLTIFHVALSPVLRDVEMVKLSQSKAKAHVSFMLSWKQLSHFKGTRRQRQFLCLPVLSENMLFNS